MKQLYIAYGSNMHKEQMKWRCPKAKPLGATELQDYKLQFNGVATIVPSENETVPVAIWLITEECEEALDRYEGYPRLYRKEYMDIQLDGEWQKAMVYIMNTNQKSQPSTSYYNTIETGYNDFGIDLAPLEKALKETPKGYWGWQKN